MNSRKVLLVGWDAADWKVIRPLMDAGQMPSVERLVRGGVHGPIATIHPPLSPMLWTSIATGKRPFHHGIYGFTEPAPDGSGVRPVTNLSRSTKAVWNILNQCGRRSVVIGWWPSHPAEPIDGAMVSDRYHRAHGPLERGWPLPAGTVHPPELAKKLAELRVHPDQITPEMVEPFIPRAREIDQDHDKRLAGLLRTLAEALSIQAAAEWLVEDQRWDFFAVYFEALDHFCHGFMRYHPPRQAWIGERDFELYRHVVAAAYRLHDKVLGRLVERAGADATVMLISDHGFHPDHLRPATIPDMPAGPAVEHGDFGIFAMSGADIRHGGRVDGASVLDVTPTLLTLFDLPVGEDMDGKALHQAFAEPHDPAFVASWEEIPGADGRHPPGARLDAVAAEEMLEQMAALGYIERPDDSRQAAMAQASRDLRYNLGEAYQHAGRHAEAYEIFAELYRGDPDEQRFAVRLFVSCRALGRREEMRCIVTDLDGRRRALFEEATGRVAELKGTEGEEGLCELARWRNLARFQPAVAGYLKAQVLAAERRYGEALSALEALVGTKPGRPGLLLEIADWKLRLGRRREAEQAYEEVLALDPDNARAQLGLGWLALRRREYGLAAQRALDALEWARHDPLAHFLLGRALAGLGEWERAAQAFRAAISLNPHFPAAHARLAALLETDMRGNEAAREHRRLARAMRNGAGSQAPRAFKQKQRVEVETVASGQRADLPAREECLMVVTGLPRSGTSLIMQMLAAGGVEILTDGVRAADEDNPRGYFEFEAVKRMGRDAGCLATAKGKAVKIVAPLVAALPADVACRAILCDRDLGEVLDSQERMLRRLGDERAAGPERRCRLQQEYERTLERVKAVLAARPATALLTVRYEEAVYDPRGTAERMAGFLGGGLDVDRMARVADAALHRNRRGSGGAGSVASAGRPSPLAS